jgi:hypothetical protein
MARIEAGLAQTEALGTPAGAAVASVGGTPASVRAAAARIRANVARARAATARAAGSPAQRKSVFLDCSQKVSPSNSRIVALSPASSATAGGLQMMRLPFIVAAMAGMWET